MYCSWLVYLDWGKYSCGDYSIWKLEGWVLCFVYLWIWGKKEGGVWGILIICLVEEVCEGDGWHNTSQWQAKHGGGVASVLETLADIGVIFLKNCWVAVPALVLLPSTASDNARFTTNVLVNFSAEGVFISIICGALSQVFLSLYNSGVVLIVEGIITVGVSFGGTLVALQTSTLVDKKHEKDSYTGKQQFRLHF